MNPYDTDQKLRKARAGLILDQPFFGALALRMNLHADPSIKTAVTDGRQLRYNPDFVRALDLGGLKAVLAHEVMHAANGHPWRRDARDAKGWNEATDYAINGLLKDAGFTLPPEALHDPNLADKAAEQIYTILRAAQGDQPDSGQGDQPGAQPGDQPGDGDGDGQGDGTPDPGGMGAVEDGPEGTGTPDAKEAEADWKVATLQAANAAKMMGHLPAGIARLIEEILTPAVDWRIVLAEFVTRSARNDYDWTRPSRRYLNSGIVLPGLVSDELPPIVIGVDTSGSIGEAELPAFAAEISAVLAAYNTTAHVVYCDAKVHGHDEYTRDDLPIELHPAGGGGTDFRPVFDWVKAKQIEPACLIYLTDLMGKFPDTEPDYPTLWITTRKPSSPVPFGEVVELHP